MSARRRGHAERTSYGRPLPGVRVKVIEMDNNKKASLMVSWNSHTYN